MIVHPVRESQRMEDPVHVTIAAPLSSTFARKYFVSVCRTWNFRPDWSPFPLFFSLLLSFFVVMYEPPDALCQKGSKGKRPSPLSTNIPRRLKTETQWKRGNLSPPSADANSDMRLRFYLQRRRIGVVEPSWKNSQR